MSLEHRLYKWCQGVSYSRPCQLSGRFTVRLTRLDPRFVKPWILINQSLCIRTPYTQFQLFDYEKPLYIVIFVVLWNVLISSKSFICCDFHFFVVFVVKLQPVLFTSECTKVLLVSRLSELSLTTGNIYFRMLASSMRGFIVYLFIHLLCI